MRLLLLSPCLFACVLPVGSATTEPPDPIAAPPAEPRETLTDFRGPVMDGAGRMGLIDVHAKFVGHRLESATASFRIASLAPFDASGAIDGRGIIFAQQGDVTVTVLPVHPDRGSVGWITTSDGRGDLIVAAYVGPPPSVYCGAMMDGEGALGVVTAGDGTLRAIHRSQPIDGRVFHGGRVEATNGMYTLDGLLRGDSIEGTWRTADATGIWHASVTRCLRDP